MKKPIKLFQLTTVMLLIVALVAACGGNNNNNSNNKNGATNSPTETSGTTTEKPAVYPENGLPTDEEVTLKIAVWEAGFGKDWVDHAMDTFEEKFPNVKFERTYSPNTKELVATKIAAKDDKDMFDIFQEKPANLVQLVEGNYLIDAEELWDRELYDTPGKTIKDIAIPGEFDAASRYNGLNYQLPVSGSGAGLWFNKALFEEHGWNQAPKTWDEFIALMDDIKADGVAPLTFPGMNAPDYLNSTFGAYKLFELADMNGTFDTVVENYRSFNLPYYLSDESIEMYNRIYEMGKKGYWVDGLAAINHTQSQMQVIQGDAALVSSGSWIGNEMKDSTPEGFEWGFMAIPMGDTPDQEIFIRHSVSNGNYIWAGKPELNIKWAKEFSVWLWNMDVQEKIAESGGMPVRKDYNDDPARTEKLQGSIKSMSEYISNNNTRSISAHRTRTMSDPAAAESIKVMNEAFAGIASGEQDPMPILEKAEKLMKEANEKQQ